MNDSHELLAEYVKTASDAAFQELVARYLDLVYSTALRLVGGNSHQAQDIAQIVMTDLARMARTFSRKTMLGGWLHRHTCFVASTVLRGERRRQARERQAVEMNALAPDSDLAYTHIAPILDEAINQLSKNDRAAILLRYFDQRDLRSVGTALGSSENAAQKRIVRALDELRTLLTHRGVTLSAAALATALASGAVTAAPAGLATSLAGTALATAAVGGGTTLTLFQLMTMTKLKLGIISAIAVTAVAVPVMVQNRSLAEVRDENESLRQQQEQLAHLAADNERLSNLVAQANASQSLPPDQLRELLRLRGEVGALRQQSKDLVRLQEENRQLRTRTAAVPNKVFVQNQQGLSSEEQARNVCINNLRVIDGASQQFALENKLGASDGATSEQILPYLKDKETLRCPSGGTYTFGKFSDTPLCSISGHAIPKN